MKCFDKQGCLTDEALRAVVNGQELSELQRLEIAEHLSFCDSCLERYSALLSEDALLTPEEPVWQRVSLRLRRRMERFLFHRVTAAVLAACFALAFLFGGAFLAETGRETGRLSLPMLSPDAGQEEKNFFSPDGKGKPYFTQDTAERPEKAVWDLAFFHIFEQGEDTE